MNNTKYEKDNLAEEELAKFRRQLLILKVKMKVKDIFDGVAGAVEGAVKYTAEHKTEVLAAASTATALYGFGKKIAREREQYDAERRTWDPSLRKYVHHKKMTAWQESEFNRRRARGERVYDILGELRIRK